MSGIICEKAFNSHISLLASDKRLFTSGFEIIHYLLIFLGEKDMYSNCSINLPATKPFIFIFIDMQIWIFISSFIRKNEFKTLS